MSENRFPTRALNEYRRRDISTYLSARYYLSAVSARTDTWARRVAIDAILARSQGSYLQVQHFKEVSAHGQVEHRTLHMPTGSEAVGEAAILNELAERSVEDPATQCVFSYRLAKSDNKEGIFEGYMTGLRARQKAIEQCCVGGTDQVVLYVDIKRFYPSIRHDLALSAWRRLADDLGLPPRYRTVGEKLLRDYQVMPQGRQVGLPIGPAFSHVVANAVLRPVDQVFSRAEGVRYFRYVDDIVLVGERPAVLATRRALEEQLHTLALEMHGPDSPKTVEVPAYQWLIAAKDFHTPKESESWPALVFGLKRAMLMRPELTESFAGALRARDFRLPLPDYTRISRERSFISSVRQWARRPWWRRTSHLETVEGAIGLAMLLRERYTHQFRPIVDETSRAEGFERKRLIPRLRYLSGRLVYLAPRERLDAFAQQLEQVPELYLHSEVMRAVASGDVSRVVELGSNAAQAVAQPLHAAGQETVNCGSAAVSEASEAALAVLCFNGLHPQVNGSAIEARTELLRFAMTGTDQRLMRANDRFVRETACLRGLDTQPAHSELIVSAFDEDEAYALDAIEQLQQSASL